MAPDQQKSKTINLHIIDAHRQESDETFLESQLVDDILLAFSQQDKRVHLYYKGKKLLDGRQLSSYKLPQNSCIELLIPGSRFFEHVIKFLRHVCLLQDTHIEELRQQFIARHLNGRIGKDEFFKFYGAQNGRDATDHLFDLIDKDKNGSIDMNEWVFAEKILEAGNHEDRIRFIFHYYDANDDGVITQDEMLQICSPLYRLWFEGDEMQVQQQRVKRVFERFSKEKDGMLTYDNSNADTTSSVSGSSPSH